jgi:hypothetical protein
MGRKFRAVADRQVSFSFVLTEHGGPPILFGLQ